MLSRVSIRNILGFLLVLGVVCSALVFGQQPAAEQGAGAQRGQGRQAAVGGGGEAARTSAAPPVFKVEWVPAPGQKGQVPIVQENVADPNLELKQYGPAAKQMLTSGTPGSDTTPFSIFSGECAGPFAITFKQKSNYIDLTGLGKMRWMIKTSGFHVFRPVVKLADGTLLVGDHADASVPIFVQSEFSFTGVRWIKLDPNRAVTLGTNNGPSNEIWVNNPDLSKVDEVGFADLMPSSGHGTGGYVHLARLEVYGKAVPREATTSSR
jgi:hypothetical protein